MQEGQADNASPAREQSTSGDEDITTAALHAVARALPDRINADPERVEQGLARLVLTVVELLREVLEHQAVRRMDGGTLTEEEVERLGLALLKLNEEYFPKSSGMYVFRGNVLLMRADTNGAAEAFREAVRRDTTNNEAKGRLRAIGRQ